MKLSKNFQSATRFEVNEGVALLVLNEASKLNPLTSAITRGCLEAIERVRSDSKIRALVITGEGRGFCVGADLDGLEASAIASRSNDNRDSPDREGAAMSEHIAELLDQGGNPIALGLRELPVPVLCAVNGVAAGGGVGLALCGDVVIAARSAFFYLPFIPALGLVPDMGASWSLPRLVGRARSLGLSLLGTRLSAEQAHRWGLIWDCVNDEALPKLTQQLGRQLAQLPSEAIVEARALFAASERHDLAQQLQYERHRQVALAKREDLVEGLAAFKGKRAPKFSGRKFPHSSSS
jgi:2-(1,2-epoxy-1,2-dihydrophenyl)acetyl-CoA isomerase